MPSAGQGARERVPRVPPPLPVGRAGRPSSSVPLGTGATPLGTSCQVRAASTARSSFPLSVGLAGAAGLTARSQPWLQEPSGAGAPLALPEPAQSCPGPGNAPFPGSPWGCAPTHSDAPAGGCCGTYVPKGLMGSEPLAAASPGPRWGASIPSTSRRQLVPAARLRGLRTECPGPCPEASACGPRSGAGHCALLRGRVSACAACVHRSWGRGGGGPCFLQDYFLIWLLC